MQTVRDEVGSLVGGVRQRALLLVAAVLPLLAGGAQAQIFFFPLNDNFPTSNTNEFVMVGDMGTTNGNNFNATTELFEPRHWPVVNSNSVWYAWVPSTNGFATIDTAGSLFDTVLAVYQTFSGTTNNPFSVSSLFTVAQNDDIAPGLTSSVTFPVIGGVEYYIAVAGYDEASMGNFFLNWNLSTTTTNIVIATNQVQFAALETIVSEAAPGFATVSVLYNGIGPASVSYATSDGTALAGQDYFAASGSLVFLAGQTNKTFSVQILDNGDSHTNKTINLRLFSPIGAALGSQTNAVVTIIDDETIPFLSTAGEFNFSSPGYYVTGAETLGSSWSGCGIAARETERNVPGALITVTRRNGSTGRVLVDFATTNKFDITNTFFSPFTFFTPFAFNFFFFNNNLDAIAIPFQDYTPTNGTLVFDDFQMSTNFVVPVFETFSGFFGTNLFADQNKFVNLVLSNPRPAPEEDPNLIIPTLGLTNEALLVIVEIDGLGFLSTTTPMGGFSIERAHYWLNEYGPGRSTNNVVQLNVILPGGTTGQQTATLSTFFTSGFSVFTGGFFGTSLQAGSDSATPIDPLGPGYPNYPTTAFTDGTIPQLHPQDYISKTETLIFRPDPALGSSCRPFRVTVLNDTVPEFNEDIIVDLHWISDNSFFGPNLFASITILYDDPPAGALDREWNPAGISATTPPFNTTPGANNTVSAMVVQPDLKVIIGGDFTAYNSVGRNRIARINDDGSLDTTFSVGTGADGFVSTLALYPATTNNLANFNKVIVGGGFTSINGRQRNGVARLNGDGTLDLSFSPGIGANGAVLDLAIQSDGKVVLVGDFTEFNGELRNGIIRLHENGSVDSSFDAGAGANDVIWTVGIDESLPQARKIVLAGDFFVVDGELRFGIARLNDDGTVDQGFDPGAGANSTVFAVEAQPDGRLLAGGQFTTFDSRPRSGMVRLGADGKVDPSFNPGTGTDGGVYDISLLPDGKAFIGGIFRSYNGTRRIGVARLFPDGSLDTSFMDTAYNQFAGLINPFSFEPPNFCSIIEPISITNTIVVSNTVVVNMMTNVVMTTNLMVEEYVMIGGSFTNVGGNKPFERVNVLAPSPSWTRADKENRYNVARLIGGYTYGPGNIELSFPSYTIDENAGSLSVTLRRVDGNLGTARGEVFTSDRLATDGLDYTVTNSFVVWPENTSTSLPRSPGFAGSSYLVVPILDDFIIEGDETVDLTVGNAFGGIELGGIPIPLGASLRAVDGTVTIADNDFSRGTLVFGSPEFTVNENGVRATIEVIRTNGVSGDVSVQYFTRNGSAVEPGDYAATAGTLLFGSGAIRRTFQVQIFNDTDVEFDEVIHLVLTNASGGAVLPGGLATSTATAELSIIDDDFPAGRLNFKQAIYTTNEGTIFAEIEVTRTGGNLGQTTVMVAATNGTALAGVDFFSQTNKLTWVDGDTQPRIFRFLLIDDGEVETPPETVHLRLFPAPDSLPGAIGNQDEAILEIVDDDAFGLLAFSAPAFTVDENGVSASITVIRYEGIAESVSASYVTSDGSGIAGLDYRATNGTLNFGPGEISKRIQVDLIDDDNADGVKTVNLTLSGADVGTPGVARLNIIDNESASIAAGTLDTTFNPSDLTGANDSVFELIAQPDGKLLIAGDFTTINTFNRNRVARMDEFGNLDALFNSGAGPDAPVRAMALQPDGRVIIGGFFGQVDNTNRNHIARLNTDGSLDAFFNPGAGADNPVFDVLLQADRRILIAGSFITVNSLTYPSVARLLPNGTVDLGFDTGTGVNGTVFALALQSDGKILIGGDFTRVNGMVRNRLARLTRDGALDLTFDPAGGADGPIRALVVESDDRIVMGGSFSSYNGVPRNGLARLNPNGSLDAGYLASELGADDAVLALALQQDGKLVVGGNFTSFNGVGRNRITRLNRDGTTDPSINFGFGANGFVAALTVQPDRKIVLGGGFTRFDDKVRLRVARIHGGSVQGAGALEFSSPFFDVREQDTAALVFVRRRGGTEGTVTAEVSTVQPAAAPGVATPFADYLPSSQTVIFRPGETVQGFVVPIVNDSEVEGTETVSMVLSNLTGGAVLGPQPVGTVNIVSDDSEFRFASPAFNVNENVQSGKGTISIIRIGATNSSASVTFEALALTATDGVDFEEVTEVVEFGLGITNRTVFIPLLDDFIPEVDETVLLRLSNPAGPSQLGPEPEAILTIIDNDFAPGELAFSQESYTISEDGTNAIITVVRTNGISGIVSVRFTASAGTANPEADFTAVTGVLGFADGDTVKTFVVPISNDTAFEREETIFLTLSDPATGATLGNPSQATLTIVDDEVPTSFLAFSSNEYSVQETNGIAAITVLRTGLLTATTTVRYSSTNGTARAPADYTGVGGLLTFLPGESNKTFTITVTNDTRLEGDETILLRLRDATGDSLITLGDATLIILDDDIHAGAVDPTFNAGTGANAPVHAVQLDTNSNLIIGGEFTFVNGLAVSRIARMTTNGTVDLRFNPGSGPNNAVLALDLGPTGEVAIGGLFTAVDDISRTRVAMLTADGLLDPFFNPSPGANDAVYAVQLTSIPMVPFGGDSLASGSVDHLNLVNSGSLVGTIGLNFMMATNETNNVTIQLGPSVLFSMNLTTNTVLSLPYALPPGASTLVTIGVNAGLTNTNTWSYTGSLEVGLPGEQKMVLGGNFTFVNGQSKRHLARMNRNGSLDTAFNALGTGPSGTVWAVAGLPNAQLIIAGDFTNYNGIVRSRVARLNYDGTLDPFFDPGIGANGTIRSVAVQDDGRVIIGGDFTVVQGAPLNGVARLNVDGSLDLSFSPGAGANGPVRSVELQGDGKLLVVGDFTTFDESSFSRIVRLTGDGLVDSTFDPGSGANAVVNDVAVADVRTPITVPRFAIGTQDEDRFVLDTGSLSGLITITYDFLLTPGSLRVYYDNFLIYDSGVVTGSATVDIPYGPGTSTDVTIVVNEGGGAALGGAWLYFATVQTGARLDNRIVIVGGFTEVQDLPRNRVAILGGNGAVDLGFSGNASLNNTVYAIGVYTNLAEPTLFGKVVVGGDYGSLVGVERNRIARLHPDGTFDTSFDVGLGANNAVRALGLQSDGRVVIGGLFTSVDSVGRNYLARLEVDGTVDLTFNAGAGLNNSVLAMEIQPDEKIIVGGRFTSVSGANKRFVARLNRDGTVDGAFGPGNGPNGAVRAIALQPDGKVLIGGEFTEVATVPRRGIARLNIDGSLDASFDPGIGADNFVNTIALQSDGRIVIGGRFFLVDDLPFPGVARLNVDGSVDESFAIGLGANDFVNTIVVQPDDKLLVGGGFTSFGGFFRNRLTRLNANGSGDATINFGSGANNFITVIKQQTFDGNLIVGGGFTQFNGLDRNAIARVIGGVTEGPGNLQFGQPEFAVNERAGSVSVAILRQGGATGSVSVDFTTVDGTAMDGVHYQAISTRLDFGVAETLKVVVIPLLDDLLTNINRTVSLRLSNPSNGAIISGDGTAELILLDNDSVVGLTFAGYAVNENLGLAQISVTRAGGTVEAVSVDYSTAGLTATPFGLDYVDVSGTLLFSPGVVVQNIALPIVDDFEVEGLETLAVSLQNVTGPAVLGRTNAVVSIFDNDFGGGLVGFSTNSYPVVESAGRVTISVNRTNGTTGVISVTATSANGSAIDGLDYASSTVVLSFGEGETNKTFDITIFDDLILEGNESIILTLSNPTGGAAVGLGTALVSIIDDDAAGTLTFQAPVLTVVENAGFARVTVDRIGGRRGAVSVSFSASGGSALPGIDFNAVSNVLTFVDGQISATFDVPILDDMVVETNETINLVLLNPAGGASLGFQASASLVIIDNEVSLGFASPSFDVGEGDGDVVITVIRTGSTNSTVGVDYFTGSGSALEGSDFVRATNRLVFGPGVTNLTFVVSIIDDTLVEGPEFGNLSLGNTTGGASLSENPTAVLNIADNDIAFNFSQATFSVEEGFSNVVVSVIRSGDTNGTVSVDYRTSDGTATEAGFFLNGDYFGSFGTLTFGPGVVSNGFFVFTFDDILVEGTETVNLALLNPSAGSTLGNQPTATFLILDNDTSFAFATTNLVVSERAGIALVTVQRTGISTGAVSVVFSTSDGTAAGNGVDYQSVTTLLEWEAADTSVRVVAVPIVEDSILEGSETINLQLSSPTGGGVILQPLSRITIVDDAGSIGFTSADFEVFEDAGVATLNLVRTGGTNGIVTVDFRTSPLTAIAGQDFIMSTGVVAFASGEATKSFTFPINSDTRVEGPERLTVLLFNPKGGVDIGAPSSATVTILDADAGIIVQAGGALIAEQNGNGVLDANETVTMLLSLINVGVVDTTNLVARLQVGGGLSPSSGQDVRSYGVLPAGGASKAMPFSFRVTAANGERVSATLQLTDGVSLGLVTFSFPVGTSSVSFGNADVIVINDKGPASPYPSVLDVSGLSGSITKVTVTIRNLAHTFSSDVDVLLVGPTGERVLILSDSGGSPASNVTLTFDDVIGQPLGSQALVSGTFRSAGRQPAGTGDPFPSPAPAPAPEPADQWGTNLAAFNGTDPQGRWSLYVVDDATGDVGSIAGGWSLTLNTLGTVAGTSDLSITATDSPDPAAPGGIVSYSLMVTNHGPSAAAGVEVLNVLPAGLSMVGTPVTSRGSCVVAGREINCGLGDMAIGEWALISFQVTVGGAGTILNLASVQSAGNDPNNRNNSVETTTLVGSLIPPVLLTPTVQTNGVVNVTLQGQMGQTYVIEASDDFSLWRPISTNTLSGSSVTVSDAAAMGRTQRFYRALRP